MKGKMTEAIPDKIVKSPVRYSLAHLILRNVIREIPDEFLNEHPD